MDISTMGTVLAIVVITYLIGLLCKSVGSIRDELIPVIVGAAGGVLGIFPEGTRHKEGIADVQGNHRHAAAQHRHAVHPAADDGVGPGHHVFRAESAREQPDGDGARRGGRARGRG